MSTPNPFRYGALALDESFTDREDELAELTADIGNGQDVVIFAPRRYGKSSLMWRVSQQLVTSRDVLVAQVDLMTTPTKEKLAEKLAQTIHDELATTLFKAKERLRIFQGLRVRPTITVDPDDATVSFSFTAARVAEDMDATLERLFELPGRLAAERGRKVALVLDEFQEIIDIDPGLPRLMRAVFQVQPEVAHVYLGSKRHMMERIFNDEQEPFWRSAKRIELGVIEPEKFRPFLRRGFKSTGRKIDAAVLDAVLEITGGHPYATQELAYFLWQETPAGEAADSGRLEQALNRVLASENAHFSLIWERASGAQRQLLQSLAAEPGRPLSNDYRRKHSLPAASSVQRALEALDRQELVTRGKGGSWIAEPFLAEWVRRLQ
ncbi:MAG TPA: ATP-binding protein [Baekduia sp.]|nr:ATP-binding protein [Baekduia sp.]